MTRAYRDTGWCGFLVVFSVLQTVRTDHKQDETRLWSNGYGLSGLYAVETSLSEAVSIHLVCAGELGMVQKHDIETSV